MARAFARVQRDFPPRQGGEGVSILTRAFARVQREKLMGIIRQGLFQSSLELSHECNKPASSGSRPGQFQSSLELSHECNWSGSRIGRRPGGVSILTRAFARVQQDFAVVAERLVRCFNPHSSFRTSATQVNQVWLVDTGGVSILTRAFARVQRVSAPCAQPPPQFQSSLELSHECNRPGLQQCRQGDRFNPHSSFRTSATAGGFSFGARAGVSILTRAFARVQHSAAA